jgi:hypothetical protein
MNFAIGINSGLTRRIVNQGKYYDSRYFKECFEIL